MGKLYDDLPEPTRFLATDRTPSAAIVSEPKADAVLAASRQEFNKLLAEESPKTEVIRMSERVERAASALRDAAEAYKQAGVPAQSEDIRALAITFIIDEGKNGRTPAAYAAKPAPLQGPNGASTTNVNPATTQDNSSVRRDFFKPVLNQEYEVTIESYDGEITSNYGTSDKFSLLVNGEPFIQTTKGKLATAYKANIGKAGRLSSSKNKQFLNYSFKVGGVEQVG
jgi:hypothetical protein